MLKEKKLNVKEKKKVKSSKKSHRRDYKNAVRDTRGREGGGGGGQCMNCLGARDYIFIARLLFFSLPCVPRLKFSVRGPHIDP